MDTNWKELGTDLSGELSGALFFWDDTQGNVGLSVCFAIDNNDPDDLLNEFDGGESAVDFDFVFPRLFPRAKNRNGFNHRLKMNCSTFFLKKQSHIL